VKFLKYFSRSVTPGTTEAALLADYRRTGDLRLLGELYQPYMEYVYAISYKYLKDEEESKDAVMQIFEKLAEDLRTHEVSNFKSWLHSVCRNYCLMQLRTQRILVAADLLQEEPGQETGTAESESSQDPFDTEQNLTRLGKCMEMLSTEQRLAVELFYKQEKCYREITEITGLDYGKVKSHIQNGKRNLKICMQKNGGR